MWLYLAHGNEATALVSDRFVYAYIADADLIVVERDPDIYVWALIAVFQPIGEYQPRLF